MCTVAIESSLHGQNNVGLLLYLNRSSYPLIDVAEDQNVLWFVPPFFPPCARGKTLRCGWYCIRNWLADAQMSTVPDALPSASQEASESDVMKNVPTRVCALCVLGQPHLCDLQTCLSHLVSSEEQDWGEYAFIFSFISLGHHLLLILQKKYFE